MALFEEQQEQMQPQGGGQEELTKGQEQEEKVEEPTKSEEDADDITEQEAVLHYMKQKGLIDKLPDAKVTDENFADVLRQLVIDRAKDEIFNSLDPQLQEAVMLNVQGLNAEEALKLVTEKKTFSDEVNENNAKIVTRNYLKQFKGMSDDEIELFISMLEKENKLLDFAKKYNEEAKTHIEQEEKRKLEEQKRQQEEQAKMLQQFVDNTVVTLDKMGLDKNEVLSFILPQRQGEMSQLEQKLQEAWTDPEKFAKIVILAMNDFDDKFFVDTATKKVKKDLLAKMRNLSQKPNNSQNISGGGVPLWEQSL